MAEIEATPRFKVGFNARVTLIMMLFLLVVAGCGQATQENPIFSSEVSEIIAQGRLLNDPRMNSAFDALEDAGRDPHAFGHSVFGEESRQSEFTVKFGYVDGGYSSLVQRFEGGYPVLIARNRSNVPPTQLAMPTIVTATFASLTLSDRIRSLSPTAQAIVLAKEGCALLYGQEFVDLVWEVGNGMYKIPSSASKVTVYGNLYANNETGLNLVNMAVDMAGMYCVIPAIANNLDELRPDFEKGFLQMPNGLAPEDAIQSLVLQGFLVQEDGRYGWAYGIEPTNPALIDQLSLLFIGINPGFEKILLTGKISDQ